MPHIDLTSVWIPGSLIGILVLIMIRLFIKERRAAAAIVAERAEQMPVEVTAPAQTSEVPAAVEPPPMADKPSETVETVRVPTAPNAPVSVKAPEKKVKSSGSLIWRTAWIWLPFLVGFFGQGYLEHRAAIDPLIKKITG